MKVHCFIFTVFSLLIVTALSVNSQTNPEPYDLSTGDYIFTTWEASQPAGTYPPNMRFHRGPKQDPGLTDEPNADYTDPYNATSGSRMNGLGDDGFSWRNIGTNGTLGAAVLALNTTGLSNILVSWTGGTVAIQNEREYRIRLQYRIGTTGSFQDVPGPIEYVASTVGHSQNFGPTLLPAEVNNQPVLQLRWKYYYVSGAGNRPQLRVGNILIQTIDDPGNGTGEVTLSESLLPGGTSYNLDFTISGTVEDVTLTHIDIVFPDWAQNLSTDNISLSQDGGTVALDNTTLKITEVTVTTTDNLVVSVEDLALPDITGEYEFIVKTGANSQNTVGIAQHPTLLIWGTPLPISEALKNDSQGISIYLGEWITIRGTITVADQFKTGPGTTGPSYLQDETGGFAVFSSSGVSEQVEIGDEVTLLGKVTQFFGLNQLDENTVIVEHHGSGNVVQPLVLTLADIANDGAGGVEIYEGMLVRIDHVTVDTDFWNVEGPGTNYTLTDVTGTLDVRINHAVDIVGAPAPSGLFHIIGVVSQFRPSPPNIGGYQLLPRFSSDIITISDAPLITTLPPYEISATDSSITISWETDGESTSEVRYGLTTDYELGVIIDEAWKENHSITIGGLDTATIYNIQIRSATGPDTTVLSNYIVSTGSPPTTTQQINIYFNKSVDHSVATIDSARTISFLHHLWGRILNANHSIDVALYSLSGSVGMEIAQQLIAARNRGLQVRVIMEDETSGTAPPNALKAAGIPFIADDFGDNSGAALHHNKFFVIDYYGGEPDEVWVITGSWNPTDPGTNQHHQNIIEIQDVALAGAFTREFEQMWGSSTTTPDADNSRFGSHKTWVNPTVFWIGDAYVRLFFSPQGFGSFGSTEDQMIRALQTAEYSINLGLNLITRITLVNAMQARFNEGVIVRGVVGSPNITGSVFNNLASWADVLEFSEAQFGLLHHKYAIVDGENTDLEGKVITGSHNWSRAANESNDENTLIIHSSSIANQYLQEFAARYKQAGGQDDIVVSVERIENYTPGRFSLSQNYPNPFNPVTTIMYSLPFDSDVTLSVYNILGQEVARLIDQHQPMGSYSVTFDASLLSSGIYIYRIQAITDRGEANSDRKFLDAKRMVLIR